MTTRALPVSRADAPAATLQLDALQDRQRRLGWWRKLAIVVSFAHMMTTIGAYSSAQWYAGLVAAAMTFLIDLAIYEMIEYRLLTHREGWRSSRWIVVFLALAIVLSVSLNAAYLWTYKPAETVVPIGLSVLVVGALSIFVPGWVAVAAIISAELEARRSAAHKAADELAALRTEADGLRAQVAQNSAEAAHLRATLDEARAATAQAQAQVAHLDTQARAAVAQRDQELAHLRATLDETRAATARQDAEAAHLRATLDETRAAGARQVDEVAQQGAQARAALAQRDLEVAQLSRELDDARAAAALDPRSIARRMRDLEIDTRKIARALERPESTVRGWVKEAA